MSKLFVWKHCYKPLKNVGIEPISRLFSGVGLFETLRIKNEVPLFTELHQQRMENSIKKIFGMDLSLEKQYSQLYKVSRGFDLGYAKVVFIPYKHGIKFDIFCLCGQWPYSRDILQKGLCVRISEFRKNPLGFSSGAKPISYFDNVILREFGEKEGFDEIVLLDLHGYLAEGTRSNIFFVKDKKIFTPSLTCGILSGITRSQVISIVKNNGMQLEEGTYYPELILDADEVFFTSSLLGV